MKYIKRFEHIRNKYTELGVDNYYSTKKQEYINPHTDRINKCLEWLSSKLNIGYFLDLSCGNGEVTSYLNKIGFKNFKGSDPYFYEIYTNTYNKECFNFRFEDIATNSIPEKFDTIICSYALHLCPKSYFKNLLYNLSINCKYFILISPSKYPIIDEYFTEVESIIIDRTHCKIFKSNLN